MSKTGVKTKVYGRGRIQFLAMLTDIRAELSRGFTLQAVYDKRAVKLGVSYSAFRKLVVRYASDARPAASIKGYLPATESPHERIRSGQAAQPRHEHSGHVDPARLRKLTHGV